MAYDLGMLVQLQCSMTHVTHPRPPSSFDCTVEGQSPGQSAQMTTGCGIILVSARRSFGISGQSTTTAQCSIALQGSLPGIRVILATYRHQLAPQFELLGCIAVPI